MTALIFDMDGVIVDSTAMHVAAWDAYLGSHGLTADRLADRMLGKHNAELVRDLFAGHALTEETVSMHGLKKEALYREMMSGSLEEKLVPGVREFIRRNEDLPLAVATNAEQANVDFVLDQAGIRSCFQVVLSGHQVSRPKPFPDIYLLAASRLARQPEDCVVFEDSLTGIQAARAAGMRVVGLTTTLTALPDVDLAIRDFLDPRLEPWLQQFTVAR